MMNESKTMRDIHEIRLRNYESEKALTPAELAAKRKAGILKTGKIIEQYALRVRDARYTEIN